MNDEMSHYVVGNEIKHFDPLSFRTSNENKYINNKQATPSVGFRGR